VHSFDQDLQPAYSIPNPTKYCHDSTGGKTNVPGITIARHKSDSTETFGDPVCTAETGFRWWQMARE
jgi:hypothetical protein